MGIIQRFPREKGEGDGCVVGRGRGVVVPSGESASASRAMSILDVLHLQLRKAYFSRRPTRSSSVIGTLNSAIESNDI